MRRGLATLLLPCLLTGCLNTMLRSTGDRMGVELREKVVMAKQAPNILVAHDQSTCVTSKSRWEKVEVGRPFLCSWQTKS